MKIKILLFLVIAFSMLLFLKPNLIFAQSCNPDWECGCGGKSCPGGQVCDNGNCVSRNDNPPPPSCTTITAAPVIVQPAANANVPYGSVTLRWNAVAGATKYALRIDDTTANSWTNSCATVNPGDVCNDSITATSYTFNVVAGHSYHWWVHALNNCGGGWNLANGAVFNAVVAPTIPQFNNQCLTAEIEPNNNINDASRNGLLCINKVLQGHHDNAADNTDYYLINITNRGIVNVNLSTTATGIDLDLYVTKVSTLYATDDWDFNSSALNVSNEKISATMDPGYYIVDVYTYGSGRSSVPYTISWDSPANNISPTSAISPTTSTTQPTPTDVPNCPLKTKGDANCDGSVNIADYAVWQQEFVRSKTTSDADFSRDNNVNLIDYAIWQHNFLNPTVTSAVTSTPVPSATGAPTATATPTPTNTPTLTPTPTIPPPLSYLRVFVTSQKYDGNLGGLSGADGKCQQLATNGGLNGTYKAFLSTDQINAKDRFNTKNLPYKLVDGTLVANNFSELFSQQLKAAILRTENNTLLDGDSAVTWAFTASKTDGSRETFLEHGNSNSCTGWTRNSSDQGSVNIGAPGWTNIFWVQGGGGSFCQPTYPSHLYCFEDR